MDSDRSWLHDDATMLLLPPSSWLKRRFACVMRATTAITYLSPMQMQRVLSACLCVGCGLATVHVHLGTASKKHEFQVVVKSNDTSRVEPHIYIQRLTCTHAHAHTHTHMYTHTRRSDPSTCSAETKKYQTYIHIYPCTGYPMALSKQTYWRNSSVVSLYVPFVPGIWGENALHH